MEYIVIALVSLSVVFVSQLVRLKISLETFHCRNFEKCPNLAIKGIKCQKSGVSFKQFLNRKFSIFQFFFRYFNVNRLIILLKTIF